MFVTMFGCNHPSYIYIYSGNHIYITPIQPFYRPINETGIISSAAVCILTFFWFVSVCPTDWSLWGSSCYYVSIVTKMSWGEAQNACHGMAAQLVKIESPEENDFILSETTVLSGHFWIGLNDLANEGMN